ncbi:hypothetical protein CLV99_0252 [Sphingobacterium yanglingense]|uniref:Uncharacterized protein n=1 Tax=Sphingobacterium yanglingense TaxID=1437280 RepID=A0A4R6WSL7_9SPHI|nr:hypothetical protein CLV99_0252 [Sphingobacterium yanglingense]
MNATERLQDSCKASTKHLFFVNVTLGEYIMIPML